MIPRVFSTYIFIFIGLSDITPTWPHALQEKIVFKQNGSTIDFPHVQNKAWVIGVHLVEA